MVTILHAFLGAILAQQASPTFDEIFPRTPPPDILAVRKIAEGETILKPCHAFTAIFEVTVAEKAVRTQWVKIARKVSRLIRVNGREHRNRLSGSGSTNNACVFDLLWPEPMGREPRLRSAESALISATCQFDLKDRGCLFKDPGEYRVEFFFEDQTVDTTVHVLPPTEDELGIIEELSTLPMLLLVADPTDRQDATPQNIARLEKLLAVPSDYTQMLSFIIGVAKGKRVGRPRWTELTGEEKRNELEERLALLTPVLDENLNTRLKGLAAYELFSVAAQLGRLEADSKRSAELLEIREKAVQKLAACPLVPRGQALAKSVIQQRTPDDE